MDVSIINTNKKVLNKKTSKIQNTSKVVKPTKISKKSTIKKKKTIMEDKSIKKNKTITEDKSTKEDINKIEIKKDKENIEIPVKKKRGRKKKIKTPEEIEREKNKPRQRRGRKPKSLITNINSKNSQLLLDSCKNKDNNETIILNLKVTNIDNMNNMNDDKQPVGYNINESFFSIQDKKNDLDIENINNNINNNIVNDNLEANYAIEDNIVKDNNWVLNSTKTCYWCCHSFNNNSFGIPIKYKNKQFYVYGCFCSLECAAAYNFSEEKNVQDIWECYNLINLFSQTINYKNIVKLAPNRRCLKIFGGKMDIEDFRIFTDNNKISNILEYPMIPISQQIEEINYDNSYNKNDYIPIDQDRVKKLEQKIKLMRTIPLLNHKNTLEHTMNIKINETS